MSTFLDIYIQRDLDNGTLTESEAQELIDHMVMKFRMVKFARIPSYNQLFSGDPVWATLESAASAWMAAPWSPRTTSASCIRSRTWAPPPSRT